MSARRDRNIFGAFALMISDDILRATSSNTPEAGPAASALALLAHKPGLSIRMLAIGVGLSHAGTVRLVDRLVAEALIERRDHSTDGRTRSLYLTKAGEKMSAQVLSDRDRVISESLSVTYSQLAGHCRQMNWTPSPSKLDSPTKHLGIWSVGLHACTTA